MNCIIKITLRMFPFILKKNREQQGKKNYQNILQNEKNKFCTFSLSRKYPSFIVQDNPGSTMHLLVETVIMGGVRKLRNTWGPLSPG